MASNVGDRILWTAVILSGIAACWYIPHVLYQAKESAIVWIPQPKPNKPQLERDAEAAIRPSTLAELADGPSYHLTASAIKLTASKFLKSDAKQLLLRDIASKDYNRRDKAINALSLLLTNPALKENSVRSHFTDDTTFTHLVTALANLLPEHQKTLRSTNPPPSPIRPENRSAHEAELLSLLILLINEPRKINTGNRSFYLVDAQPAINAGIITRWLKHYPFPCDLSKNRRWNYKRRDVVHLLRKEEWGDDDEQMSALVSMLMKSPTGARQLTDVGLRSSSVHDRVPPPSAEWRLARRSNPRRRDGLDDISTTRESRPHVTEWYFDDLEEGDLISDDEMIARLQQQSPQQLQRSRPEEAEPSTIHPRGGRTATERSLRRRHRQAIVVAEAGMPLREENILQRRPTETETETDFELTWPAGRDQIALERIDGMDVGSGGFGGSAREGPVPPSVDLRDMDVEEWLEEG